MAAIDEAFLPDLPLTGWYEKLLRKSPFGTAGIFAFGAASAFLCARVRSSRREKGRTHLVDVFAFFGAGAFVATTC